MYHSRPSRSLCSPNPSRRRNNGSCVYFRPGRVIVLREIPFRVGARMYYIIFRRKKKAKSSDRALSIYFYARSFRVSMHVCVCVCAFVQYYFDIRLTSVVFCPDQSSQRYPRYLFKNTFAFPLSGNRDRRCPRKIRRVPNPTGMLNRKCARRTHRTKSAPNASPIIITQCTRSPLRDRSGFGRPTELLT